MPLLVDLPSQSGRLFRDKRLHHDGSHESLIVSGAGWVMPLFPIILAGGKSERLWPAHLVTPLQRT